MICMPLFNFTRKGNCPSCLPYSGVTGSRRYSGSIMVGGMQTHSDGTYSERSFVVKILFEIRNETYIDDRTKNSYRKKVCLNIWYKKYTVY